MKTESISVEEPVSFADEDIKPTSTTLQFGDGEIDKVYGDMQRQKDTQKESLRLNGKGKLVMVLYALAVTVILALIVLNTGVLTSLKSERLSKESVVSSLSAEVQSIEVENAYFYSEEYVGPIAEQLGMVKGN